VEANARPDDPNRYLMISVDCHANEPAKLCLERMDKRFHNRLPRIEVDTIGVKWSVSEGNQRSRLLDSNLSLEHKARFLWATRQRLPHPDGNCFADSRHGRSTGGPLSQNVTGFFAPALYDAAHDRNEPGAICAGKSGGAQKRL